MSRLKLSLLLFVKEPFSLLGATPVEEARQLVMELKRFLEETRSRVSLFLPGSILQLIVKKFPEEVLWMRDALAKGRLEMLGGGYTDAMLPLFPTRLQNFQLQKHRECLEKYFMTYPEGYFNSSLAWEIGMTETLANRGFSYALVGEEGLRETFGVSTRISGWFVAEDRGVPMRLVPVALDLSDAASLGAMGIADKLNVFPESDAHWISQAEVPLSGVNAVSAFFSALRNSFLENGIQSWTVSRIFEQRLSGGKVNLMSSVSCAAAGLPPASRTCRELLIRRPEVNFLHKSLLLTERHAENALQGKELREIQNMLLPVMAPRYYANLYGNEGVRSPGVRWKGNQMLIRAESHVAKLAHSAERSLEIGDFLMEGHRQVLLNNPHLSFLLDAQRGASLRSLIYKPSEVNLAGSLRQDGGISYAFYDHLLESSRMDASALDSVLEDRSHALNAPYEYQLVRGKKQMTFWMSSEQVASLSAKRYVFHLDKIFTVDSSAAAFGLTYTLSNATLSEFQGLFGTELNLGMRTFDRKTHLVKINGRKVPFDELISHLHSGVSMLDFKDGLLSYAFRFTFKVPVNVLLSPVLGAAPNSAAPNIVQGLRLFFFRELMMKAQGKEELRLEMKLAKRGIFW